MLKREGEQLVVEESMTEIVRPVLEVLCMSLAIDRDSNNSFFNPDILATQVLSFKRLCTLSMHILKSVVN